MKKVIYDEFYFWIAKLKNEYATLFPNDYFAPSLIGQINRILRKYNKLEWQDLKNFYLENEELFWIDERLVFLIIIDLYKNQIKNYDINVLQNLISTMAKSTVNPSNYQRYFNLFLYPPVFEQLAILNSSSFQINPFIEKLIEDIPMPKIVPDNYDYILNILTKITGFRYSPIFNNDFSLKNIYTTLYQLMLTANENRCLFLEEDFIMLTNLSLLENNLDNVELQSFTNEIKNIEDCFFDQRTALIRYSLKAISKYHLIKIRNFKVIRSRKAN